jgi:hypothetical protein
MFFRATQHAALTVKNFAIANFSCSGAPTTSVKATRIIAGGPTGMSIMENQSIGSEFRRPVLVASAYITGILILQWVSVCSVCGLKDVQRPHDESHKCDEQEGSPREWTALFAALHQPQALA